LQVTEPHIIWNIAISLFVVGAVLGIVLLVFLIVMNNILYKRLDSILFKEPWFNPQQLVMLDAWPLSFIKTIIYMFLIAYPDYIRKKKRFKNLKAIPEVQPSIKLACKIYTALHLLAVFIATSWLIFIFGVYVMDNWFS